jgi:hypothetical protein
MSTSTRSRSRSPGKKKRDSLHSSGNGDRSNQAQGVPNSMQRRNSATTLNRGRKPDTKPDPASSQPLNTAAETNAVSTRSTAVVHRTPLQTATRSTRSSPEKIQRAPAAINLVGFTEINEQHMSGTIQFADSAHTLIEVARPQAQTARATAATLTPQQIKDNQAVKQAFLNVIAEHFDGLYLLEVTAQIGSDGTSALTVPQIRDAFAFGRNHRLIERAELAEELERRFPIAEQSTSQLDRTIAQLLPLAPPPPPQIDRGAVQQAILKQIAKLAMPPSPYLLDQICERVIREQLDPTLITAPHVGPSLTLGNKTLPPRAKNAPVTIGGFKECATVLTEGRPYKLSSIGYISPATYFNAANVPGQPFYSDWAMNFAMLQQLAINNKIPVAIRKLLDQRSLSYLYKFASGGDPIRLNWQSSPLMEGLTEYHRAGETGLSLQYSQSLGRDWGFSSHNKAAIPVSSPQALDAVKRHFEFANPANRILNMSIDNVAQIAQFAIEQVTRHNGAVLIDINHLLARIPQPNQLDAQNMLAAVQTVVKDAEAAIATQLASYVRQEIGALGASEIEIASRVRAMMEVLNDKIAFGGTIEAAGQPVLLVNMLSGNKGWPLINVLQAINHGGFTAGPAQVIENWTKTATPVEILNRLKLGGALPPNIQLPAPNGNIDRFSSIDEFSNHQIIKQFKSIINGAVPTHNGELGRPPYVYALGTVTQQMIDGLKKLPIHQNCTKNNADTLLQYLYNRILGHIQNANAHKDDMAAFINDTHLIHEEIATMLAIAQPYRQQDLDLGMPNAGTVRPRYEFKNSGMNAFNAVLSGIEAQKGSRALNVATQKGSYYEQSMFVVGHSPHYQKSVMDGEQVPDSLAKIRNTLPPGQLLDLFVGEFHHNISTERNRYQPENLIEQVRAMLDAQPPLVSPRFTVAIDSTIGLTDAPEIANFLKAFRAEIAAGTLNVVLFRSGQKFDMAGMDNFNGGLTATYNATNNFATYNAGAADAYPPAQANLQGMMHLEHSARQGLDLYRSAIMAAHRQLLMPNHPASLPRTLIGTGNTNEMLQIAPNTDRNVVFLDIRSPLGTHGQTDGSNTMYLAIKQRFEQLASEQKLMHADRPSFGFPHLNVTLIGAEKLRINLGLESEASLKVIRDNLVLIDQVGSAAHALGADTKRLQRVLGSDGNKLFTITRALAQAGLQVGFEQLPQGIQVRLQPNDAQRFSTADLITLGEAWARAGFGPAAVAVLDFAASRNNLTPPQQEALAKAYFDSVTAHIQAGDINSARVLLTQLEGGKQGLLQPAKFAARFAEVRTKLIDQVIQPQYLDPALARTLIKANLDNAPNTAPAAKRSLQQLFDATWETAPDDAAITLAALDQAQPAEQIRTLKLSARLARSPALTTEQRNARLAQLHTDIVAQLQAQIVTAQTGLVEPGLGLMRALLKEYRESALAAGPQALDRMFSIMDMPGFAPLFQAAPELRLEAQAVRTNLALAAGNWGQAMINLELMAASVPPAPLTIYSATVAKALDRLVGVGHIQLAAQVLLAAAPKGVALVTQHTTPESLRNLSKLMFQFVQNRPDRMRAQPDIQGPSIFDTPEYAIYGQPPERDAPRQTRKAGEQQIAAIRFILDQLAVGLSAASVDDYRAILERIEFDNRDFFRVVPELAATAFHSLAAYDLKQRDFTGAIRWAEKSAGFVAPGQGADLDTLIKNMAAAGAKQEANELTRRVAAKLPGQTI